MSGILENVEDGGRILSEITGDLDLFQTYRALYTYIVLKNANRRPVDNNIYFGRATHLDPHKALIENNVRSSFSFDSFHRRSIQIRNDSSFKMGEIVCIRELGRQPGCAESSPRSRRSRGSRGHGYPIADYFKNDFDVFHLKNDRVLDYLGVSSSSDFWLVRLEELIRKSFDAYQPDHQQYANMRAASSSRYPFIVVDILPILDPSLENLNKVVYGVICLKNWKLMAVPEEQLKSINTKRWRHTVAKEPHAVVDRLKSSFFSS